MCGVVSDPGCSLRASLCYCIKKGKMCSFRLQLNILTYATSGAGRVHSTMAVERSRGTYAAGDGVKMVSSSSPATVWPTIQSTTVLVH